jgi:template-activating factor I
LLQVNEEASNVVLEVEQKYNEIRRPVYARRNEVIKKIPDFWLTAVCISSIMIYVASSLLVKVLNDLRHCCVLTLQFLSHPMLADLLTEDDTQVPLACI